MKTAKIAEIFESIQGEGLYQGTKQVFVRFYGCNFSCVFCDTPLKEYREYNAVQLKDEILRYRDFHSVSLTGGEPLCQADFLKDFLGNIRDLKLKIYLETNGILATQLAKILDFVDIVAMDFKLPSSTHLGPFWRPHEDFLKMCGKKEVFIKIVVTKQTRPEDIATAGDIIKRVRLDIPLVLQPNWFDVGPDLSEKMASYRKNLMAWGVRDVRILSQAHKSAGIR